MVTEEAYNAVTNYFSALSHIGYKPDSEVNKLVAFTFMEEMLYGRLSEYMTEEDYNTIRDSMECLYGSCMMPYPDYKDGYDEVVNRMNSEYGITEEGILRATEYPQLRTKF